jgi:glycosyltransferase involved in cell wall biosynthesis
MAPSVAMAAQTEGTWADAANTGTLGYKRKNHGVGCMADQRDLARVANVHQTVLAAPMLISIIVPAFNEEKLLGASLRAIQTAAAVWARRGWMHELIVCDNNSTDRTAAIAAEHGATVVFEPVNQIARARNRGASVATGRWLLFIDADSRPNAPLFDDLAAAIETGDYLACGARFRFDAPTLLLRLIGGFWSIWSRVLRHMAGSFVAVEANAFRAVGGFSSELYVGEELDLSHRLQRLGRDRCPPQRIRILSRHPLLTSARKIHLYSTGETLRFALHSLRNPRRVMRTRESCDIWYDGRR